MTPGGADQRDMLENICEVILSQFMVLLVHFSGHLVSGNRSESKQESIHGMLMKFMNNTHSV